MAAGAVLADRRSAVGDEEDGRAGVVEAAQALLALLGEGGVAHRQDLVEDEDLRQPGGGDREAEPGEHARGVVADRRADEVAEAAEVDDLGHLLLDLAARAAEQQGVQVDVLEAGQLVVEAGAELQDRRQVPAHRRNAGGGLQDPRDHLEQRALAGAVAAHDPQRLAAVDAEIDVAQRPELLVGQRPTHPVDRVLLERRDALLGQPVAEGDPLEADARLFGHG